MAEQRTALQGKTALITGAAKRIGRETALTLAQQGVNIIVHYNRSREEAESLRAEVETVGVRAWSVKADFADSQEYEGLFDRAFATAGQIDILINNASIFPFEKIADMTFASFMANMEVNAWVPFLLSRQFAQRVGRGKIINLLDSRLRGYDWNHVAYYVSKHALAVLTRMTALEYAPNITVNAVAPGLILPPPGKPIDYIERMRDTVPLKQHGDPQGIADAILFLLQSEFITGDVIYVDGGRHLQEYSGGSNPH